MPDWTKSMEQSFEYCIVDPGTWRDKTSLRSVISCSIDRDADTETLGSATIDLEDQIGECYIRVYLVTIQNGIRERFPLGTFLVQTPHKGFDGKRNNTSADAYTPLLELKENPPPLGYSLLKGDNIMSKAYVIVSENARAPVFETINDMNLHYDFVANTDDTWLSFVRDLIASAKYTLGLDELGRVMFMPVQEVQSLQPVCTFNSTNSSILYQDITLDHDLYNIPNVVEVTYSNGGDTYHARVVNDDPNSPISTVNRGREITKRVTNPNLSGDPTRYQIEEYADQLLRSLSTLEYTIGFTHGYRPVRLGDCIRLNYPEAKIFDVKAKVISQTIDCKPGCPVKTKAVYTSKLWR